MEDDVNPQQTTTVNGKPIETDPRRAAVNRLLALEFVVTDGTDLTEVDFTSRTFVAVQRLGEGYIDTAMVQADGNLLAIRVPAEDHAKDPEDQKILEAARGPVLEAVEELAAWPDHL